MPFFLANFRLHEYHKSTAISKKIDITVPVIIFVLKRKLIFTYPLNSLYEAYIMYMHIDTVSQKIDGKFIEDLENWSFLSRGDPRLFNLNYTVFIS